MKRLLLCLLALTMVLLCFSSCDYINGFVDVDDGHTEHTFEYIAYESGHFKQFTCGCPSPEIMEMHRDENGDGICDLCNYETPRHEHTMTWTLDELTHSFAYTCGCVTEPNSAPHSDTDRDGYCDACKYEMGEKHPVEYRGFEDGHSVITLCGCCEAPAVVDPHVDDDLDDLCDLCGYLITVTEEIPLIQYEPWLGSIAKEEVKEIITHSLEGWTSPDLQTIISTTNQDIIGQIIDEYRQVVVLKNDWIDYDILAGSFEIEFYLADGSVEKLNFYGGGYFYGGYPVSNTPSLEREEFIDVNRRYSVTTYRRFEQIYSHDMMSSLTEGIRVSRINPQMLEFKECKCEPTSDPEAFSRFYYYIETDDGRITFFDEGKHLMFDGKMYDVINFDRINLSGINTVRLAREEMFNDGRIAFVENYYGIFDSGAIVAMVTDDKTGYTEALWSETVAGYTIRYADGNRIVILYDGEFYSLSEAYDNGYLTEADIFTIWKLHN